MTREEARELISKHSYKDELGRYVISKKIAFIIADCLENEALKNRKCNNCKYNKKQESFMVFCDKKAYPDESIMGWHCFTKDFSCKFWEQK